MRGLIVDDDALFARTLARGLHRHGLETATVATIGQALALARGQRPDFALVDLNLGSESGLALIAPLRQCRADGRRGIGFTGLNLQGENSVIFQHGGQQQAEGDGLAEQIGNGQGIVMQFDNLFQRRPQPYHASA